MKFLLLVFIFCKVSLAAFSCTELVASVGVHREYYLGTRRIPSTSIREVEHGITYPEISELSNDEKEEVRSLYRGKVQELDKLFSDFDELAREAGLKIPKSATIYYSLKESKPHYNPTYTSLHLGHQTRLALKNGRTFLKHPKYSHAVQLHEYGHRYFMTNFSWLPCYTAMVEEGKRERNYHWWELGKKSGPAAERAMELKDEIAVGHKEVRKLKMQMEKKEMLEAISALTKEKDKALAGVMPVLIELHNLSEVGLDMMVPYEELYADVVAVIGTGDPQAMYHSLRRPSERTKKSILNRAFGRVYLDPQAMRMRRTHGMAWEVRQFIGRELLPKAKTRAERAQILSWVTKAMEKEFKEIWEKKLYTLTADAFNQRLIEKIKNEIALTN